MPIKTVAEAIREATIQLMEESEAFYVIGEGITEPKGAFGTTVGLKERFPRRVFEMPVSENGMTGVAIGSAVNGMRPIMVHMRADFLLYAADQIINNAAKWHMMFGGQMNVPMVIRAVVGRGWGQGAQHSQHLEELFAQIPGLHVVMPSNAYNAKGLLIAAARDNNPVVYFEHRWIHHTKCEVPDEMYEVPIGEPRVVKGGNRPSMITQGHMVNECIKASEFLERQGFSVGVIDRQTIVPMQSHGNWIREQKPFAAAPPSPYLSRDHYTSIVDIMRFMVPEADTAEAQDYLSKIPHDVPNPDFRGPF